MKRAIAIVAILLVVGAVLGGAWWYVNANPEWWFWAQDELQKAAAELGVQPEEDPGGLVASGFIEAEEASVTTEMGGRIMALHAGESDEVAKGQVVAELDDSLLLAQIEMAETELGVAEATLDQVRAGVQEETLDHARAQLEQARAAQAAALVGWEDAQAMLENPQELELALTAARAQLAVLGVQTQQALAMANSAQAGRDLADQAMSMLEDFEPFNVPVNGYEFRVKLPADMKVQAHHQQAMATYGSWEAWMGLDQAQAARAGADDYLAELRRQKANPLALQAQVNAAESQYRMATSVIALAQAQLHGLQIGATPEQIAAVEAQVGIARAAREALDVRVDKLILKAPITGLVLERPVHVGEVALPGAPLMTLADLDNVTLTIYVPENQLGEVQLGQPVAVRVDAYPDRTFGGTVSFIASQAEFTPKNVQTREERVNMVFAVKVKLPNEDHALKPGMPADAVVLRDE